MCLKTLVIFNSEIKIKNTTNTGMEGRALMLTERLKRLFSQQASGIDYAILLAPIL
jgi:hypothetical protein